jgi:hypothetical protein
MRWLFILLVGFSAQAQYHHPDQFEYTINLEASGFTPDQKGSEYFYEVEIISNYGTLNVKNQVDNLLRRAIDMREEIGAGRLYGAPLAQWFPSETGGVNMIALEEFKKQLNKKIEGLETLQPLCQTLHANALFRASSERVKFDDKRKARNFENVEIQLGEILTMFHISELVEAVSMVSPLPALGQPGEPAPQKKESVLEKMKAPQPMLLWTVRLLQKDPKSQPKVIQETKAIADIRPHLNSIEFAPVYAMITERDGLSVKASIKREIGESTGRKACYRPVVGF